MSRIICCVAAVLLLFPAAGASALEVGAFEVRGGITLPSNWDTGFTVGAAVDLGELWLDNLHLYPGLSYQVAEDSLSLGFGTSFDVEISSIALGAEVRYFPRSDQSGWYFGGGPYLHFVDREFGSGGSVVSADSQELGLTGVAGYRLGGGLFGEGRYMVVSNFNQAQLLGFSF